VTAAGKVAGGCLLAVVVAAFLLFVGVAALLFSMISGSDLPYDPGSALGVIGCGGEPGSGLRVGETVGDLDSEQLANAKVIVATGVALKVPARGHVIAVAVARQESGLRVVGHGDAAGPDSRGLFQQRAGWGPEAVRMDPAGSSGLFYRALLKVPGWEQMPLTVAAQKVQVSAFPDAYAKWEALATQVVKAFGGGQAAACAPAGEISSGGWTLPVPTARVGSGFGPRGGGFHAGEDFITPTGSVVRAAHAGIVTVVRCQASGGSPAQNACAAPGGMNVQGCGWYVEIDHGGGVMTRYCHGLEVTATVGMRVDAGTPIMRSDSTGNSSGPHLHFEVHTGGGGDNASAVDPITWLRAHGVKVGNPT
jgi:murein DD-endopeptidase MepM/ murein hydrolase activator NlpD